MQLQEPQKLEESVESFLLHLKLSVDELVAASRSLSAEEFNVYVFEGLCKEFKDPVTVILRISWITPILRSNFKTVIRLHLFSLHHLQICPIVALIIQPVIFINNNPQIAHNVVIFATTITTIAAIITVVIARQPS